jgi:acetolactate decarboxylase
MRKYRVASFLILLGLSTLSGLPAEVQVIGEMRRMFIAHDIGPNVDPSKLSAKPHLYALGPVAGLTGEITILDSSVLVSKVETGLARVSTEPGAKAVFLVYSYVAAWRSINLPTNVVTETDLSSFLEHSTPANSRASFLVRGTALGAKYHIQNYQGKAEDLTHEAHDKAKVFFELPRSSVQLVGFFSNREEDGGSFVHRGQTTHIHIISDDQKSMGHLETITLAPGAKLFLPASE